MIDSILSASGASVVVIAPHPDDESLATGGLIQAALAHGARVTVVLLTDGDNNPWPQRAVEHRIWIGSRERERWGRRRRAEAHAALDILGVSDESIRYLGLPDLGLTRRLTTDTAATVRALCGALRDADPTIVISPSLADLHPDHSAAHIMSCLALAAARVRAKLLSYTIHGPTREPQLECVLDQRARERKSRAVGAHQTQLVLSRKRIRAHAQRPERFAIEAPCGGAVMSPVQQLPWRIGQVSTALTEIVLIANNRVWFLGIERQRSVVETGDTPRCVRDSDGRLSLQLPEQLDIASPAFVKLAIRVSSPWIYDRWGWVRLGASK